LWMWLQRPVRTLSGTRNRAHRPPTHPPRPPDLRGTIPASIGSLAAMEHLALDTNLLTGTVPPTLCAPGSALKDVYLRGNMLTGDLLIPGCEDLINLDVQVGEKGGAPLRRAGRFFP
jgi:hypothetical protein